ncbi:MAG: hypothetical protein EBT13_06605 [Rhodobacteraceae bacterium]|nr:hypothetical protein [Paracoccaceae bacterium]
MPILTEARVDDLTYPNGFRYIGQKLIVGKRKPFVTGTDLFPDPGIALEPLIERIVPQVDAPKIDSTNLTDFAIRRQRIQAGLAGQSELVFLCAQLVMILRRDPVPPGHVGPVATYVGRDQRCPVPFATSPVENLLFTVL